MRRNKHNLGHYHLLTGDMGKLYPAGLVEVLPGDTFQHSTSLLIRFSPLAAPVMHPVTARVHHFFIPNRLVWEGWEDFITGGEDGNNSATPPKMMTTGTAGDLLDYFGLPQRSNIAITDLPVRAYNMVWNEYYRDQDLQDPRGDLDLDLANIAWAKDQFTAARPWEQKGPDVTLPLGSFKTDTWVSDDETLSGRLFVGQQQHPEHQNGLYVDSDDNEPGTSGNPVFLSGDATAVDINELRKAFALQRYAEARAQYGSRYVEYLRYLGIRASDARLNRPEYLGGGKVRISTSEVLQTAPESGRDPDQQYGVGDMYGHGIGATRSRRYRRFFEEHGYVLSLVSVRPHAMYVQGVRRDFLRNDREDYFQKELQFIGQQPVYNNELYGTSAASGSDVFGYTDRYKEYRENPSQVSGEFRDILNYWHLARDFATPPALNEDFIKCEPSKRIFNVQEQDTLWMMVQHQLVARRLVAPTAVGKIL